MHHRTTCGASSNSHTILFDIMVQLEPQGCYFNTPPPASHSSSTFPPITSSLLLAARVRTSGSHLAPHPWGFCMLFFVSLSFQSTDPAPKTFAARKISLTSECPCFYIWVIKLNIWKYFLHVLYESKWRKLWGNATFLQLPVQMILFLF